jgi:hypothetical protein
MRKSRRSKKGSAYQKKTRQGGRVFLPLAYVDEANAIDSGLEALGQVVDMPDPSVFQTVSQWIRNHAERSRILRHVFLNQEFPSFRDQELAESEVARLKYRYRDFFLVQRPQKKEVTK